MPPILSYKGHKSHKKAANKIHDLELMELIDKQYWC